MKKWFLISYDVRNEKRLRKVAQIMEGHGQRIQYSVFRTHLSDRGLERLRWELGKVMDSKDGLLIMELCDACVRKIRKRNSEEVW
ncbi:MAG: CRISPR-associated endonuclease Cas2, partial [Synergistales bacterium]|nr:CRISPR-associated endonuclease Cas2 [Synergistales bacterium]